MAAGAVRISVLSRHTPGPVVYKHFATRLLFQFRAVVLPTSASYEVTVPCAIQGRTRSCSVFDLLNDK